MEVTVLGWLANYPYRKAFVVAAGVGASTLFQYPIKVYAGAGVDGSETLSDMTGSKVYVGSKCTADFGNITFTSSDGTTELSHWRQTYVAGVSAVFWVKTPDATANQTIYFYYGFGVSKSNQANTFVDVVGGVVGAWNMEEANAGDAVLDYSGNSNNGTPTGTAIIAGKHIGKTARMFTSGDIITINNSASLKLGNNFSYFAEIKKIDSLRQTIIGCENEAGVPQLESSGANQPAAIVAGQYRAQTAATHNTGSWTSIGYSKNGAGATHALYIAGNPYDLTTNLNAEYSDAATATILGRRSAGVQSWTGAIGVLIICNPSISATNMLNLHNNYPDVGLEVGKVLVRKYASTTNPAHASWSNEEVLADILAGQAAYPQQPNKRTLPAGPPAPHPTMPNEFLRLVKTWLETKTKHAS